MCRLRQRPHGIADQVLDHLLIFSARHLEAVIKEFPVHYTRHARTKGSTSAALILSRPSSHCLWSARSSATIGSEVYSTDSAGLNPVGCIYSFHPDAEASKLTAGRIAPTSSSLPLPMGQATSSTVV